MYIDLQYIIALRLILLQIDFASRYDCQDLWIPCILPTPSPTSLGQVVAKIQNLQICQWRERLWNTDRYIYYVWNDYVP